MVFSEARKLLLVLVVTAFLFSESAEAWSWSCSWGWSSNGTDLNWGWGCIPSSKVSSGTESTTTNSHSSGSNHSSITGSTYNHTTRMSPRRKITVTVWESGFDYAEWASKHAPFYVNDVLVFKYNNNNQTQSKTKHSSNNKNNVYLLHDLRSYKSCDVASGKKLIARGGSSSGSGFKLLLRMAQTYYFTSEDHNGCNHNMKFSVHPIRHPSEL